VARSVAIAVVTSVMGTAARVRWTVARLDPMAWAIWRIDIPSALSRSAVPI